MNGSVSAVSQDLHDFVADYSEKFGDDVLRLDKAVLSPNQELTAIVAALSQQARAPMVIAEHVHGLDCAVITNVFASRARLARVLAVEELELHAEYQRRAQGAVTPVTVSSGPALDVVVAGDEVDVRSVPMLRHFEGDAGPYITSGIIVAETADGHGNMSYHRAMVHTTDSLATSLHSRGDLWRMLQMAAEAGTILPVAMVIGGHPLFMLAASARVPFETDERDLAGGLFGSPLEVVRTPIHGIRVPATADYVLEGTIDASDHVAEGPFGEFSGYSSNRSTNNLFRVQAITHRSKPMLVDVVGGNTSDHLNLSRIPREAEMAEKLKSRFPDVVRVHWPTAGTHFLCFVSVRQRREGLARQVMLGLLGWDPYVKLVVAVDEDVDVTRDADVLWAIAVHFQPHRDLLVVDGLPGSPLDPSASMEGTTSRMGLDATRSAGFSGTRISIAAPAMDRARDLLGRLVGGGGAAGE